MKKNIVLTGAIFICIAIILGAIAAHSLEKIISTELIQTFEKGVKYMLYSGLGLLILGLNHEKFPFSMKWVYILLINGTLLFSGNIFLYVFHELSPGLKNFVHIVPIGGLMMILAWLFFIVKLTKIKLK